MNAKMPAAKTGSKKATTLSPKRREALERLRDGGILVADKHFLHYIDGWEVVPQNFYWLVQHRLIRVLDPTRKSEVKGNGHIISEKGLALLASLESTEGQLAVAPSNDGATT